MACWMPSSAPEVAEGAPEAASETTTLGAAMVAGAPGTALRLDGRRCCLGLVGCASTCMMLSPWWWWGYKYVPGVLMALLSMLLLLLLSLLLLLLLSL